MPLLLQFTASRHLQLPYDILMKPLAKAKHFTSNNQIASLCMAKRKKKERDERRREKEREPDTQLHPHDDK